MPGLGRTALLAWLGRILIAALAAPPALTKPTLSDGPGLVPSASGSSGKIRWPGLRRTGGTSSGPGSCTSACTGGLGGAGLVPCWATSAPKKLRKACRPEKGNPANGFPPTQPSDFAAFVKELAGRYKDKITALEIWNEPDQANEIYFGGPNKAQRYAELVRAAYPAIKQADPNIKVLAGSLVGSNGVFLKALYAAGIKGYYDGLAVHFYTLTLAALREFRSIQVASGDNTPLWLDEFGWSSCYPHKKVEEETACVTRAVQAQNVTNMYRALSKVPYLATDTLYKLEDSRTNQSGVMTLREGRKPSFSALARVVLAPNASPSKVQLSLRSSHGQVTASGSGPFGDFMRLEAFQGSTLRYRATFTLDRFNRFKLKLPRVLGAHLRVRVYQEWTGLAGGATKSV